MHAKRGTDAARYVRQEIEPGNSWQSTKLIYWKISPVSKSCSGQVEQGVQGLDTRLPAVTWRDGRPLDRLLIKVLARSNFILSWKVSKRPPVMCLILSPSSHI